MKKYTLLLLLSLMLSGMSCNRDDGLDEFGINRKKVTITNAMIVDTRAGWTLLSEDYGFLELIEPLHDTLQVDGLKVQAGIYKGRTYYNDPYDRNFTYAELASIEETPELYDGPSPPVFEITWAPDYEDFEGQIPDGYGCFIQARVGGFKILVKFFHVVPGTGSFRTELEATKVGMLIMHLLMTSTELPYTEKKDYDFLKIDYYEFIPTPP